ncbi:uncharacterized protein LOC135336222 [Halichondria panicea]|uniref:uncharacterized protein LOC135336222 n=1 Tax=Halichondria panicea TaxID=6063 RepID=UPI00312B3C48
MQPINIQMLVVVIALGWTVCCEASNTTRTTPPEQPGTVSDSNTTIRYLIVAFAGGLLAVSMVMVALVFTLACYFSTSNLYRRLRRPSRPPTVIAGDNDALTFVNPLFQQERGPMQPARLVPSLRKGNTTTVITLHQSQQETDTVGYDQSNQVPLNPAHKLM